MTDMTSKQFKLVKRTKESNRRILWQAFYEYLYFFKWKFINLLLFYNIYQNGKKGSHSGQRKDSTELNVSVLEKK